MNKSTFASLRYHLAVLGMAVTGISGILGVELLRPNQDNMMLHSLIVAFLTPSTMSLLALMKVHDTHLIVNSRMDELLKLTKTAAFARGQLQGPAEQDTEGAV